MVCRLCDPAGYSRGNGPRCQLHRAYHLLSSIWIHYPNPFFAFFAVAGRVSPPMVWFSLCLCCFGHQWELYSFWAFVPFVLKVFLQNHPDLITDTDFWSFTIIAIGSIGCITGGIYACKYGSITVAMFCLFGSGIMCLISPLLFFLPPVFLFLFCSSGASCNPEFSAVFGISNKKIRTQKPLEQLSRSQTVLDLPLPRSVYRLSVYRLASFRISGSYSCFFRSVLQWAY